MKKVIYYIVVILLAVLANLAIVKDINAKRNISVDLNMKVDIESSKNLQVFYSDNKEWNENNSYKYEMNKGVNDISVPIGTKYRYVRIDFQSGVNEYDFNEFSFSKHKTQKIIDISAIKKYVELNEIQNVTYLDNMKIITDGEDPYIVLDLEKYSMSKFAEDAEHNKLVVMHILICILIDVLCILAIVNYAKIHDFVIELWTNKSMIFRLAKNDFRTKYAGSYFGIFWAFVQPVVTIMVYWFVFQVGFQSSSVDGFPFVIWLTAGMVPWFLFNDGWFGGTNCLIEYSYLVKKVVFKISILPIVKILSAAFVNIFFIALLLIISGLYGNPIDLYCLQLIYYEICMIVLLLGLSYICCSLVVFFKDLTQIINIILQIGVWLTPIMWNKDMLPLPLHWILKANPVFYIVQGVRNSVLYKQWFWEDIYWTVYFWIFSGILFLIGVTIFKKLKLHFSDVL